jgi:hypothetical protein
VHNKILISRYIATIKYIFISMQSLHLRKHAGRICVTHVVMRWDFQQQICVSNEYKDQCGRKLSDKRAWQRFYLVPLAEKHHYNYYIERSDRTACKMVSKRKHGNSNNHKIKRGNPCFRITAYCLTTRVVLQLRTMEKPQRTASLNEMRVCVIKSWLLLLLHDWQSRRLGPLGLL